MAKIKHDVKIALDEFKEVIMKDIQSNLVNVVKDALAVNQSSTKKKTQEEENIQPGNVNDTEYDSLFPILEIDKLLQFDKLMTDDHDDIQQKLVSVKFQDIQKPFHILQIRIFFVNIFQNNDILICSPVLIFRLIIGLRSSKK